MAVGGPGITAYKTKTSIPVSENGARITGLEIYGDPETLYVCLDNGFGEIKNNMFYPIPIREFANVKSEKNGRAHCVSDVYLFLSMQDGVERFYRSNLDDVGPNREAGLPANRQGPVVKMTGYPGRIYAAVDGGSSGYSSVLVYQGSGWHEVYRAPRVGERIRNIYIQSIPGSSTARLWISQGSDVLWVPISLNPYTDPDFRFHHEGSLTTGWLYAGMQDVYKLWKKLKVFAENVTAARYVKADYQVDGDTTWTEIGTYDSVPVEELSVNSTTTPRSRRIRFRFRLYTDDNTETPRMKAYVVEGVSFAPVKYQYGFSFRLAEDDQAIDLRGGLDKSFASVEALHAQLLTWANNGTELTWRCIYSPFDNKKVFIDPVSLQPLSANPEGQVEKHAGNLTIYEA
jgi:hypothetical protein